MVTRGDPVVEKVLDRYGHLPPLVLHRSVERARTPGELFDFLDGFPKTYPVAWDDVARRWGVTDLLRTRKH